VVITMMDDAEYEEMKADLARRLAEPSIDSETHNQRIRRKITERENAAKAAELEQMALKAGIMQECRALLAAERAALLAECRQMIYASAESQAQSVIDQLNELTDEFKAMFDKRTAHIEALQGAVTALAKCSNAVVITLPPLKGADKALN
jgi:hypothetical protein